VNTTGGNLNFFFRFEMTEMEYQQVG